MADDIRARQVAAVREVMGWAVDPAHRSYEEAAELAAELVDAVLGVQPARPAPFKPDRCGSLAEHNAYVATAAELERIHGYRIDAVLPCGCHRYWSTHCRHGFDSQCNASKVFGLEADAPSWSEHLVGIQRRPAQCKSCSAPCVCPCHREADGG